MKTSQYIELRQLAFRTVAITLIATSSHAIAQPHFTAVRAQIDTCGLGAACVIETKTDPSFAEAGSIKNIYAKARASFGNNGGFATASNQPAYLGAYAESIWMDGFNIAGNVGTGYLNISVLVSGTLDGNGKPGGPGSNSYYGLYVSDSPISCDFDAVFCTGTSLIPLTEPISGSRIFTNQLPFTYGEPFYVASYLGAEVIGNGFADFYGSAKFGATAPGNVPVVGNSGVTYSLASSVPEPTTAILLFVGLAVLGFTSRKIVGPWE